MRPGRVSWTRVLDACPGRVSWTHVLDACPGRTSWTRVLDACPGRMSWTHVLDACPGRCPGNAKLRLKTHSLGARPGRVSWTCVLDVRPGRASWTCVLDVRPGRVSWTHVLDACPGRVRRTGHRGERNGEELEKKPPGWGAIAGGILWDLLAIPAWQPDTARNSFPTAENLCAKSTQTARRPGDASWTRVLDACPGRVSWTRVLDACPGRMSWTHVLDACPGRMSWTHVLDACPGRMSWTLSRKCQITFENTLSGRTSWTRVLDVRPGRASWTCVLDVCPGRASWTCVLDACPGRMSWTCAEDGPQRRTKWGRIGKETARVGSYCGRYLVGFACHTRGRHKLLHPQNCLALSPPDQVWRSWPAVATVIRCGGHGSPWPAVASPGPPLNHATKRLPATVFGV